MVGVGGLVAVIGAFGPWLIASGGFGDAASVSELEMIPDLVRPIYSPILPVAFAMFAVVLTIGLSHDGIGRIGEISVCRVSVLTAVIFVVSPETVVGGWTENSLGH